MEEISKMTMAGSSKRKSVAPRPRVMRSSSPVSAPASTNDAEEENQRSISDAEEDEQSIEDHSTSIILPDRKRPYNVSVDPARYRRVTDPEDPSAVKFACSLCGNLYKWRKSLNKHWKEKHHNEEAPPLDAPVTIRPPKTPSKSSEMIPQPVLIPPVIHPAFSLHPLAWLNFAQQMFPSVSDDPSSNVPLDLTMKKKSAPSDDEVQSSPPRKKFHRDSHSSNDEQRDSANAMDDDPLPNGQKMFFCSICHERCLSIDTINRHFIDHHFDDYQPLLNESFRSTTMTLSDYQCSDSINPLKCIQCDFVARWPTELQKHAVSHSNSRPFKCIICSLSYKWRWDLAKHWDRAHGLVKKGIPLLNPYKKRERVLLKKSIEEEDQSESPLISDSDEHSASMVPTLLKKGERTYQCRWCDFRGRWQSEVLQHMRYHHAREKPYRCSDCSYGSSWKWDVQKHMRRHHPKSEGKVIALSDAYLFGEEEKPNEDRTFLCEQCPFSSVSINDYRRHLLVHSSECPYRCCQCQYQSKWKSEVKKHMKEENHLGPILIGKKVVTTEIDADEEEEESNRIDEKTATMFEQCSVFQGAPMLENFTEDESPRC